MRDFMPILTFDANSLSPSFGYLFDRQWLDPYESIVSILWKFARANGIPGHEVTVAAARQVIDPYVGLEAHREAIDFRRLQRELGISRKTLREATIPARRRTAIAAHFRYCAPCLGRGYHSPVHQFESVQRCPIHDQRLHSACRRCGYSALYRLNALFLETPFICPACRLPYGTQWPSVIFRSRMPMKDLVSITRIRIARCLC